MPYCVVCRQEILLEVWDAHVKIHGEDLYRKKAKEIKERGGTFRPARLQSVFTVPKPPRRLR